MKRLTVTALLCAGIIGITQADTSSNSVITQYQSQVSSAQSSAISSTQSSYYPAAQPTTYSSSIDALNYIAGGVNALVTYTYNTLTTLLFTQTYNVAQGMAGGSVQPNLLSTVDTSTTATGLASYAFDATPTPPSYTGQAILNTLTTTSPSNTQLVLTTTIPASLYSMPPCSSSGTAVTSTNTNCYSTSSGNQPPTYTSSFNLNSLIGPSYYQSAQKQTALNFVQFASGQAQPLNLLDMSKCTSASCLQKPAVAKYLASLRAYAAQQSVGTSALYEMFAERNLLTQDTNGNPIHLGQLAGIPSTSPNYPDASPMQVEYYLAARRLNDSNWWTAMETANTATLLRENTYIAAENRLELLKLRLAIERLTAVMSVMQLQQLRQMQTPPGETIKDQVDSLNKTPPFSGGS